MWSVEVIEKCREVEKRARAEHCVVGLSVHRAAPLLSIFFCFHVFFFIFIIFKFSIYSAFPTPSLLLIGLRIGFCREKHALS